MSEKYIRQILKRIKCSKTKKEEIRKQLQSDITAEIENGAKPEDITEWMGTPEEIAEEFNRSFSDEEKKKYRREKWGKRILLIVVLLLAAVGFVYWAVPKSIPLEDSKVFQKEDVQAKAEQVVQLLDAGDYETLQAESNEKMKPAMTEEFLEEAKSNFGTDWGAFQSFGNVYLAEVSQLGKRMAVVQINASYENASITYTLSFDTNMELSGLWMK